MLRWLKRGSSTPRILPRAMLGRRVPEQPEAMPIDLARGNAELMSMPFDAFVTSSNWTNRSLLERPRRDDVDLDDRPLGAWPFGAFSDRIDWGNEGRSTSTGAAMTDGLEAAAGTVEQVFAGMNW